MLHNSFSVDIMVYALQLKQKFTTGVFHEIVRHFRTATFENKLWWLILKRNRGGEGHAVTLVNSGFDLSRVVFY